MKIKYRDISRRKTPWDSFTTLSPLETFIKNKYVDTYNYKHPLLKESGESDLLNSFKIEECKYCHSKSFKKKGYTSNGVQRYYCLDCHRSFTILTNTIFENHKISITEWIEFCLDLFYYDSISVTSKTNKNGYNTSKYWLHKLFLVLDGIQEHIVLQGNVQIDETFYPVSKSDKILKDGKELRGLSKNQYCIGIGFDGTQVYARVEGVGKTSQKQTLDTFRDHIAIGSKIIHDKEKSHRELIKEYGFEECL